MPKAFKPAKSLENQVNLIPQILFYYTHLYIGSHSQKPNSAPGKNRMRSGSPSAQA